MPWCSKGSSTVPETAFERDSDIEIAAFCFGEWQHDEMGLGNPSETAAQMIFDAWRNALTREGRFTGPGAERVRNMRHGGPRRFLGIF